MRKFIIVILCVYFSLGFILAMYSYNDSIKTFDCVYPEYMKYQNVGMGGFYINPNPEFCTRRGFTVQGISMVPFLTVFGVPLIAARSINH